MNELDPSTIKAAAIACKGLVYQKAEDDITHIFENIGANIGKDSKESIDKEQPHSRGGWR